MDLTRKVSMLQISSKAKLEVFYLRNKKLCKQKPKFQKTVILVAARFSHAKFCGLGWITGGKEAQETRK
jgi:hypothetical protein